MTEGCIGVSVEGGCVGVSVEDPGIPDITIGCCEQGPSGPPGPEGPANEDGVESTDASVANILTVTQAEYDALTPPDSTTLYLVCEVAP